MGSDLSLNYIKNENCLKLRPWNLNDLHKEIVWVKQTFLMYLILPFYVFYVFYVLLTFIAIKNTYIKSNIETGKK